MDENKLNKENQQDIDKDKTTIETPPFLKKLLEKVPLKDRKMWILIGFACIALVGIVKTAVVVSHDKARLAEMRQDSTLLSDLDKIEKEIADMERTFGTIKDSMSVAMAEADSIQRTIENQ
jgi:uncharacterized protein YlxW (UPF0749 family)